MKAKVPELFFCDNCKDRGTIHCGFLYLTRTYCPVCKGHPKDKFRELHPIPHMPPK